MLEAIHSPAQVRALSLRETEVLAGEIRRALIDSVALTGGHLASNLGAVELTLALHRVLDTPRDKIIFDVGHQSYTHKLITGRQALLENLRGEGGVSGFPKRAESEYDVFETGHASTALSAALGMARARDVKGEDYTIATLVGDGALTGGMCYEALNDAGSRPTQLIMLLNDNEMSIAQNVGALSKYLTRLRGSERWIDTKHAVKRGLNRVPLIGPPVAGIMERMKRSLRLMLIPGEFFEALGFGYLGPIDGHDIATLERALYDARAMQRPVVVHAVTQKGKGYEEAERHPERFHGVSPGWAKRRDGVCTPCDTCVSAAKAAGEALESLAARDERVMAITAAMPQGTGLERFAKMYPERFFDVGIAEEHAMTLAAGMAAAGMRPVYAVYATFLTRAVDQLLHDVCLQRLPVTVLVDHAGFVPGDGATHQGVYDLAALRAMPGLAIWSPCDVGELEAMLAAAMRLEGPCVIRYPKELPVSLISDGTEGGWPRLLDGEDVHLVAYGHALRTAYEVSGMLRVRGYTAAIWNASQLDAVDEAAVRRMRKGRVAAVIEEHQRAGGLGEAMAAAWAAGEEPMPPLVQFGVPSAVPGSHSLTGLALECGLDAASIAGRIERALDG